MWDHELVGVVHDEAVKKGFVDLTFGPVAVVKVPFQTNHF